VSRYLHCPEQYRLYYVERLRLRVPAAGLIFGQILHQVLAQFFRTKEDPVESFRMIWAAIQDRELRYGARESWKQLADAGESLLKRFLAEDLSHLGAIEAIEQVFRLQITSLAAPFVGVVDLVAELDGRRTVIDFKTAAKVYAEHEVVLADQLTAYELAHPDADQVALCVFVKTSKPEIHWYTAERKPEEITGYVRKVEVVGQAIAAEQFYRRPGWWCGMCDYLPVCLRDEAKVRETLVQLPASN
jgi:CRISPR/Cas system-associated exonuclease Cas4 (RecB family)